MDMIDLLKKRRKVFLFFIDMVIFLGVYFLFALFHSLAIPGVPLLTVGYALNALVFFGCIFSARLLFMVYFNVWRYANSHALLMVILADFTGGLLAISITTPFEAINLGLQASVGLITGVDVLTILSRLVYQQGYRYFHRGGPLRNKIGVAIVGAGTVGSLLAEELTCNPHSHYYPVCFIDRSSDKVGSRVAGVKVYAEGEHTISLLKSLPVAEIFIAVPTLTGETARELHEFYSRTGCKVKLYDFPLKDDAASDPGDRRVLRQMRIEDLLFRDSIKVNDEITKAFYTGKTVLVTGGGGSIGSELCRQIAKLSPARLIIFDIYENNAYDIQQELIRRHGAKLNLSVEIGSVRERARLEAVFAHYRPEIVFHAAAHKHVPLMEHSNQEAIKNNCLGTYNTADMAEKYGAKKFILISTDKAVNPTNVMGASKRVCEMIVQCRTDSETAFAAVRFGNVLGSNGSVIPLFRRQIESGGPITITDKRIIRYFMTIPEASGLVMQAGAMAKRGELFVLDMGKPVRILDLAENMVRLSGLVPYRDIDIVETGLRPGEKLYEELLIKTETLDKTENNMIFIEKDTPYTRAEVEEKLDILRAAIADHHGEIAAEAVTEAMKQVVPTFHSPETVNKTAAKAAEMQMVNGGQ